MNVQQKLPKPQMHRSESVDFLEPDNVPTLDVDGVANVLFNTTTVTLEFFKTIPARSTIEEERGDAQPTEQRMIVGRLTLPSAAFYELVANVTLQVRTDRVTIDQRNLAYQDTMKRALDLIEQTR
jgi:hypothetical protein